MKIITGLGNPGDKYAGTRHNAGFAALLRLSDKADIRIDRSEHKALTGHGIIEGEKVILAMPQTFMNLSGEAVSGLLHFYKCGPEDLIVIYDDIDLDTGRLRIRKQGSAGGHNGMKSIIRLIGTEDFVRIRIGIGHKPSQMDLADYVLGRFSGEDLPVMRKAADDAADAAQMIIGSGADAAMNKYN